MMMMMMMMMTMWLWWWCFCRHVLLKAWHQNVYTSVHRPTSRHEPPRIPQRW